MLYVGFNTPFRITILLLIRRFCKYELPEELMPKFIVLIVNKVLFEDQCQKTCSEPTLTDLWKEILSFIDDQDLKYKVMAILQRDIEKLKSPYTFDKFMSSLGKLLDDGPERNNEDIAVLDKASVLGLFVRKCRMSYNQLSAIHLSDIHSAYLEYANGIQGDVCLLSGEYGQSKGWISDHNVKEFLKYQAEQIEMTGTTNISTTDLHQFLEKIESKLPLLTNIKQVRYLNYMRSKEYIQSLSQLHLWSDMSLEKEVNIQYALLNTGILEYKFGHLFNALSALNDALAAARSNKDEFCLQEVKYWIEVCRKDHPFNEYSSYTDPYLKNMKNLNRTRNMLRDGAPCRYVFENLYKSSTDIISNDIKYISRVQFLITSLAWQRYGNHVLSNSYLDLTRKFGGDSIDEIENTAVAEAYKAQSTGDFKKAIEILNSFVERYKDESDFLFSWRQARARILKQFSRKRHHNRIEDQGEESQFSLASYSEECFDNFHDQAYELILKKEFEKALQVLNSVYDFIQKTDQISYVSPNLILQATVHMDINSIQTAISLLVQSMKASKKTNDIVGYYRSVIKLSECYIREGNVENSMYMLENIFPKVLLMNSELIEAELNLTYASALWVSSSLCENKIILDYILKAEEGFKKLHLRRDILKTLHFKLIVQEKLQMVSERNTTLEEIRSM